MRSVLLYIPNLGQRNVREIFLTRSVLLQFERFSWQPKWSSVGVGGLNQDDVATRPGNKGDDLKAPNLLEIFENISISVVKSLAWTL